MQEQKMTRRKKGRTYSSLQTVSIYLFSIMILFVHLPLGGGRQWAWASCLIISYVAISVVVIRIFLQQYIKIYSSYIYLILCALIIYSLAQIYFPMDMIESFVNNSNPWENKFLPRETISSISLTPLLSMKFSFCLILSLFTFFLSMQLFRKEETLILLSAIVIISISLNAFIGFYNQMDLSGVKLFCYIPPVGNSIRGTFVNRNHFAVLMELGCCSSLGLFCAAYFAKNIIYKKTLMFLSGILFIFITTSALFSFSRTGISLTLSSVAVFFVFIMLELKKRKKFHHSIALVVGGLIIFTLLSLRGLGYLWDRYETTFNAQDASLNARFAFWETGLNYIKEYWLTGTGFNSYTFVSTKFERGWNPYGIQNHLHNDWLELFCEVGVPLASIIIIFTLVFFAIGAKKIILQKNPIKKWIGLGVTISLASAMAHEFVGFAFRKPGIMVILFVLITIFIKCAFSPKSKKIHLSKFAKYAILVLSVSFFYFMTTITLPYLQAGNDVSELEDISRAYYPLKTNMAKKDYAKYLVKLSDNILKEQESGQAYSMKSQAYHILAKQLILEEEVIYMSNLLKKDIKQEELKNYPNYRFKNYDLLTQKTKAEAIGYLEKSVLNSEKALAFYPTRALYFARFANNSEKLAKLKNSFSNQESSIITPNEERIAAIYANAHKYAPKIGDMTKRRVYAKWRKLVRRINRSEDTIPYDEPEVKEILELFKEYARQVPRETYNIYKTIWSAIKEPEFLIDITPKYMIAHTNLYTFFLNKGLFKNAIQELEVIKKLNEKEDIVESQFDAIRSHSRKTNEQMKNYIISQEAMIYSLQNNWDGYKKKTDEFLENQRKILSNDLSEIRILLSENNYHRAYAELKIILSKEPTNPETILLLSKTCLMLGYNDEYSSLIELLLFSKDKNERRLYKEIYESLQNLGVSNQNKKQISIMKFYKLVALFYLADNDGALDNINNSLQALIEDNYIKSWRNSHLVHYYLAETYNLRNMQREALESYADALVLSPRSRFIWDKANSLLGDMINNGKKLEEATAKKMLPSVKWFYDKENVPQVITNIKFGNNINLYGITVKPKKLSKEGICEINYYWECLGNIKRDKVIACQFFNDGEYAFSDSHSCGNKEEANDMVGWKIGEIVKVTRRISPYKKFMQQRHTKTKFGKYDLKMYLYVGGLDTYSIKPNVECKLSVFNILKDR